MPMNEDINMASELAQAADREANSGKLENPESLVMPEFKNLVRLVRNMYGPKGGRHADWWSESPERHVSFAIFDIRRDSVKTAFQVYRKSAYERAQFETVVQLLSDTLQEADLFFKLEHGLPFVTEEEISSFRVNFAVGSGALELFIDFMNSIYEMFEPETLPLHHLYSEAIREYTLLRKLPSCMLALLRYLRGIIPRHEYDPMNGFRELSTLLNNNSHKLPNGSPSSTFTNAISKINLASGTFQDIQSYLESAFHDLVDSKHMHLSIVAQGPHGLNGFYQQAIYILDVMEVDDPRYDDLYDLYQRVCFQAARKVVNWLKSCGKTQPKTEHTEPRRSDRLNKK
ncbi:hypothetical protein VKT23_016765 [Stygiomarasmius scandens]|uniref:Uncharacterized protein n=1 Tax=Marasmiellus scandens TaxID=2682957 RepID=A0ABR1IYA0_9AGAR